MKQEPIIHTLRIIRDAGMGGRSLASLMHLHTSEEFELTVNTLQAHMKPHGKLILKPLMYFTVLSRDDLTAVTFL